MLMKELIVSVKFLFVIRRLGDISEVSSLGAGVLGPFSVLRRLPRLSLKFFILACFVLFSLTALEKIMQEPK